ncbi:Protein tyrosine kinase [Rhizoctonia solani]|uniref:Protein tyrosine kinase n=1 Tax=Rhizoctonia solani TaxID=456999 RepID=A0A8H7M9I4_9AGAM|nr:Protein tyrosine kinase [Rhizoctonia solani]
MEHVALDLTGLVTKVQSVPFARGGFADIWLGELNWLITSPVQRVAIKVPHVTSKHLRGTERQEIERRLARELKTWRTLRHPNILPLLGTCTDLGTFPFALPLPSMITEFCPLGTLADYLVEHDEPIDDLAMASTQSQRPPGDFGLSRAVKNSDAPTGYTTSAFHGSMRWMSPELHYADEDGRPPAFTPASDVWAFGMVMLERDVQDPSSPVGQRSLSSPSSSISSIRSRLSSFISSPTTSPLTLEPTSLNDADTVLTKARRAYTQRDIPLARQLYTTAAAAFASASHQLRHAQTLTELARVDKPNARVHLEAAMETLSSPHQPMYQVRVQRMVAEIESTGEAKRLLLNCRSSAKKGGWVDEEGAALIQLGQVHVAAGEDDDAYGWFGEAIRLGEKQDKATIKSEALEGRGGVSMRRGNKEAAIMDFEQAAVEYRHCGVEADEV